ncbi:MAG: hypothetical protein P1V35_10270, partial [Planctomycetota bacterium]|nr:hypothetical protein [Planctomycetota bacterium]
KQVRSVESLSRQFLERSRTLDRRSAPRCAELARWAEEQGLPAEARALWLRVLTLDGDHEQAWKSLGGRPSKSGWGLRIGSQTFSATDLSAPGRDWKHAIELPTSHFLVKTNGDLTRALDICLELEHIYHLYYKRLGQPIELYPFEWVPEIRIHGAGKRAPQPPVAGVEAWYDKKSNVLMVYGDHAQSNHVWRAAVDMMIENSFRMAMGNRSGSLPVWAHEGIANGFVLSLRATHRDLTLMPGIPYRIWFQAQARLEKKLSVRRVFTSSAPDYGGGSHVLGYKSGAYTLVFYLLNGEDGKYQEPFFDYLRGAFRGKGSLKQFERAFPVGLNELSDSWVTFVEQVSGT